MAKRRLRAASWERKAGKQGVFIVGLYAYYVESRPLLVFNSWVKNQVGIPPAYRELVRQLAQLEPVSQTSDFERAPGQIGSRCVWTRKIKTKTAMVALSEEQYHWLKQAESNQPKLSRIMDQMQKLSRKILFESVPGVVRRKCLTKKVLGLN